MAASGLTGAGFGIVDPGSAGGGAEVPGSAGVFIDEPGRAGGGVEPPGMAGVGMELPGSGGGVIEDPGSGGLSIVEPGKGGGVMDDPGSGGFSIDEPGRAGGAEEVRDAGGGSSSGISGSFGRAMDEPGSAGVGVEEEITGATAGGGTPFRWKEPIGGGAWVAGCETMETGCPASVPGIGGEIVAAGVKNWPIVSPWLPGAAGARISAVGTATGGKAFAVVGSWEAISQIITPSCATTSAQRVPHAAAEARSRSGARMEEGGVTGCWKKGVWYGSGLPVSMLQGSSIKMPEGHPLPWEARDLKTSPHHFLRAFSSTPAEMAAQLCHREGFVWMDSSLALPGAVSVLTAEPVEILQGHIDHDWEKIGAALRTPRSATGGLYGWVGYDGRFVFGVYPHGLVYDHDTSQWYEFGQFTSHFPPLAAHPVAPAAPQLHFQPGVSRQDFVRSVQRAQEYITAGDIYQVNLSYPWQAAWPHDASSLAYYLKLRAVSPAPHAAYLQLAGTTVLSASPELFLSMDGSRIATRPIKGTRPRFAHDAVQDAAAVRELTASPKERAELLMITDLQRNDLGQVCEFGSVAVPELWTVESFAQVFHLVSTVTGTLRPHVDHVAAFRACFPGGSITGAPKKRACEIIDELEPHPRGLYTGAIGWFGFDGRSQWNIAIRTAVQKENEITFHVGAGIVADSEPEREYEETLHKAAGLLEAAG